jgi:hypothetical protein
MHNSPQVRQREACEPSCLNEVSIRHSDDIRRHAHTTTPSQRRRR